MTQPHLFVQYKRGETPEVDSFSFGVYGAIPTAQLVGFIIRVQAELAFRNPETCGESRCVIAYDPKTGKLSWFVDSCIPVDALVGTLELIKCQLIDSQMMHMAEAAVRQAETGLVSATGKPILKRGN